MQQHAFECCSVAVFFTAWWAQGAETDVHEASSVMLK